MKPSHGLRFPRFVRRGGSLRLEPLESRLLLSVVAHEALDLLGLSPALSATSQAGEEGSIVAEAPSLRRETSRDVATGPELVWSTYLGGSEWENCTDVAVDGDGNLYVTGWTESDGWASGGFDTTYDGGGDALVAKLTPAGDLVWSTYLGGSEVEYGCGVEVDGEGNVYVAGWTRSPGWVSGGLDTTFDGGKDAFVVKLTPEGGHGWSTYLGGSDIDEAAGIALGGAGNVYVTGTTWSDGWVSGGYDTTLAGFADAFVATLTPAGDHVWSTYLGGGSLDIGRAVAVDDAGNVYVTGWTPSSGWVSGGFDTTLGGIDSFAVKLTPTGDHEWSTYLGGSAEDDGYGVAVDDAGNVYVTGWTESSGWVSGGFDTSFGGGEDAFVVKLTPAGGHAWSTYLGGSEDDWSEDIAVDGTAGVYTAGRTRSSGWASGGFDTDHGGSSDAYVVKLMPSGEHGWSTYLGGSQAESGSGVTLAASGTVYVTGRTLSSGWVSGGFDTTLDGLTDAFVARIADHVLAEPGHLDLDTMVWAGGALNPNGPAPGSLGIVGLDTSGNPDSTVYAVQVGTDPDAGWLYFVTSGGRTDAYADGTEADWHTAAEWAGKRLRGLEPGTAYDFYAKASDGQGAETALGPVGSYRTNEDCDVNRNGLATALDYAYIKSAILRGGAVGLDQPWACDVNDDARVDSLDLAATRFRILNPLSPAAAHQAVSVGEPLLSAVPAGSAGNEEGTSAAGRAVGLASASGDPRVLQAAYFQFVRTGGALPGFDRDGDGDVDRDDIQASQGDYARLGE